MPLFTELSGDELQRIGDATELQLASSSSDGALRPYFETTSAHGRHPGVGWSQASADRARHCLQYSA